MVRLVFSDEDFLVLAEVVPTQGFGVSCHVFGNKPTRKTYIVAYLDSSSLFQNMQMMTLIVMDECDFVNLILFYTDIKGFHIIKQTY
jgi:hypothetical protein